MAQVPPVNSDGSLETHPGSGRPAAPGFHRPLRQDVRRGRGGLEALSSFWASACCLLSLEDSIYFSSGHQLLLVPDPTRLYPLLCQPSVGPACVQASPCAKRGACSA